MGDENFDARESQGAINNSQAEQIEQQFGDRQDINTGGGDASGRDIDKRTTFIFNLFGLDPSRP